MLGQILGLVVLAVPLIATLVFAFLPERKESPVMHKRWRVAFIVVAVLYSAIIWWQQKVVGSDSDKAIQQTAERVAAETAKRVAAATAREVTQAVTTQYAGMVSDQKAQIDDLKARLAAQGKDVSVIKSSNIVTGKNPVKVELTNQATRGDDASRHLTDVQRVRLRKLFSSIDPQLDVKVESVAGDVEAMQYANEINDLINEVRHTTLQVIRGLSWAHVPQGICICFHSEDNLAVKATAEKIAQEMLTIGIAVLYDIHQSWPDNRVTILVGTKAIT